MSGGMNDLSILWTEQDRVSRWTAEVENATARLQIARMNEHIAHLLSQHEPVASLGLDRERLRLVLNYIRHGEVDRLFREYQVLRVSEANGTKGTEGT